MVKQCTESVSSTSPELALLSSPVMTPVSVKPADRFWQSHRVKALVAMVALYIIWGTTLSAMHFGIQSIPPAIFACARYLFVAAILLPFCKFRSESWPNKAELWNHVITGVCLFTVGNATAIWAVQYIPTVLAGALMATTPFWMIGLAALQPPREPLSRSILMGLFLGFSGIMAILAPQFLHEFVANDTASKFGWIQWLSVIGMLSTTVFWSIGSLYAKKHPTKNSMLMTVAFQNLSAGIAMLPFTFSSWSSFSVFDVTSASFAALMYLVLIATVIAVPCYFYVLKNLPVSLASTFAYVSPIITMIVGHFVLKEALSPTLALGAILVLGGVILVQRTQQKA